MNTTHILVSAAAMAGLALTLLPGDAHAGVLDACGGVASVVLADGDCEVVPFTDCETGCDPDSTETVCAARLYTACESECSAGPTDECTRRCSESCTRSCLHAGHPDCFDLSMADCQLDCNVDCISAANVGECHSACAQSCAASSDEQCGDLESAISCEAACDSACAGSCQAIANWDCQLACQSEGFSQCKQDAATECDEEREQAGAAIFCGGQYLASAGDLDACADELEKELGISLDIDDVLDPEIGSTCFGFGGEAVVSCAVAPRHRGTLLGLLFMLGFGAARLRRRG